MSGDSSNSCVETPAAPEWLSKLENRREKLKRTRLGHEAGAGAPCTECGDKCPGLDLHFWRKVCRNCKCRKDQHMCADDDLLSGWAQFEILGQIRSKPAFIKIKALASAPVQLEWVPPNAAPDVVSDYMDKLGKTKIPVAGSDAAYKRKQQLEFQVPPHDLDAALCDNLTESETMQLEQYVQKIRENCVGQGNVVRIGRPCVAHVGHVMLPQELPGSIGAKSPFVQVMASINEVPVNDPVLCELLSTDKLAKALLSQEMATCQRMFVVFSEPICESTQEFQAEPILSQQTKEKLCGLNKQVVQSMVQNGPIYEKILAVLKHKNLDVSRDPKLGPIADFRKEYVKNPRFKQEIDSVCSAQPQFSTPIKSAALNNLAFNSPLSLKNPIQARFGAQMRQDTPLRKVKFGSVSTIIYDCDLPVNVDYERDPIFAQILSGEPLAQAFKNIRAGEPAQPVVLALTPLSPDFMDETVLSEPGKRQLQKIGVDTKTMQSALLNGRFYDNLFNALRAKGIDYNDCKLLRPLQLLREALVSNKPLFEEVRQFVAQLPNNADLSYATPQYSIKETLSGSHSSDSGFDSKPSTPNQGAFPSLPLAGEDMLASAGRFACIPGIEDMNMYPTVEPGAITQLPHAFRELQIVQHGDVGVPAPVLHCSDCQQPINFGDVAVKAERAGKEIAWHPECFKCHTCRELLADLVYFFHGGQVYCGRDLAIKLKIPRCKACDELIFTKEYTAAEGATFHVKHFCCYHCDTPLAGQKYIPDEKSNMPLCLKCYDEFFAIACQRCSQIIGPTDQGVAWGDVHWHGPCFVCAGINCGTSLIGGRFCVKQNLPFCSPACVRSIIK